MEEKRHEGILYTDAALPKFSNKATIVVTTRNEIVNCASLYTTEPEEAEEAAIALALTQPGTATILTDSMKAYNRYRTGRISETAAKILTSGKTPETRIELIWVTAHSSIEGNEFAHRQARDLNLRATEETEEGMHPITKYAEILKHYRENRRSLPRPHPKLSREEQSIYRQIQAASFPHPLLLNRMFPIRYAKECPLCSKPGTLKHTIGECAKLKSPPILVDSVSIEDERWEILLTSPALEDQLRLIHRGQEAREAYGNL